MCIGMDLDGYWEPQHKHGLGRDVSLLLFRSPSSKAISSSLDKAKTLIEEKSKRVNPVWSAEVKTEAGKEITELQELVKMLESPNYPVQQISSLLYSGGLSRKHAQGGRLDAAGILIEGNTLLKASNDVRYRSTTKKGHANNF